jgi:hypothetical protein
MLVVVIVGTFGVALVAAGLVSLYEQGLYTERERAQASQLFKLRRFLWLLVTAIGVVYLGSIVTGNQTAVFDYSFSVGFVGLTVVFVERRLRKALDRDRTPLEQRVADWWRHPSEA